MPNTPTQDEILARYNTVASRDMFGFESDEYLSYLDDKHLRPLLNQEAAGGQIGQPLELNREKIVAKMRDYINFAWEKANDERGISASRSVLHYVAWTWLAGDREFSAEIERMGIEDYAPYGKPILRRIEEFYGWGTREND